MPYFHASGTATRHRRPPSVSTLRVADLAHRQHAGGGEQCRSSDVPRSGCAITSATGSATKAAAGGEIEQRARLGLRIVVQVLRDHEDEQDLHELAGLEVEAPDLDPARRAADVRAEHEHQAERDDAAGVEEVGEALEVAVVDRGDDHAEQPAHHEPVHLRDVDVRERGAPAGLDVHARRAVQVDDAQGRDGDDAEQERHVDLRAARNEMRSPRAIRERPFLAARACVPKPALPSRFSFSLLPLAHHARRDRHGVLATTAAVLDQHHDGDLGRLRRRVAREPGVVAVEVPDLARIDAARSDVSSPARCRSCRPCPYPAGSRDTPCPRAR